jgi:phage gp46-like protein
MTDIKLIFDEETGFDIAIENGDLVPEPGLETSVLLSLFLDRRADDDDDLPDSSNDRRGWWADSFPDVDGDMVGSRLWLLSRSKEENDTLIKAKEYAEEAMQWMIEADDPAAKSIEVTASHVRPGVLGLLVQIYKPDGTKYEKLWKYHLGTAA